MDKNKLHDEIVVDESRKLYNILNFQDFMLEESKKDKKEAKKCKKLIKNREEYIEDMYEAIKQLEDKTYTVNEQEEG